MVMFAQIFLGLAGVQIFFLISRAAGAPWGIFAPGVHARDPLSARHRLEAALAAAALIGIAAALVLGLYRAPVWGWGAVGLAWLWFLVIAVAREEGEQLLWRPVNGIMAIAGGAATYLAQG